MILLAIDPGPLESAYCYVTSDTYNVLAKGKLENEEIRSIVRHGAYDACVIEECIARKWAGREISDTAFESGRIALATPAQLIINKFALTENVFSQNILHFAIEYSIITILVTVSWITVMFLTKPDSQESLKKFYRRKVIRNKDIR